MKAATVASYSTVAPLSHFQNRMYYYPYYIINYNMQIMLVMH